MTTYSGDIRERLKDLIETYVTVFKSTQDYPGTVYDKQPMTLIRAVLPVAMIIERPVTYDKDKKLGTRMIFHNPARYEISVFFQEWMVDNTVNFNYDHVDSVTQELEDMITLRPQLASDGNTGLANIRRVELTTNTGLIARQYPPIPDGTWYITKAFPIDIFYNRSI